MRKLFLLLFVMLAAPVATFAQNTPKVEVFGNYSYLRSGLNTNCWEASLAANINSSIGIVADFSGHYGSSSSFGVNEHFFLFGPKLSSRGNDRFTPFAHALFGAEHAKAGAFRLSWARTAAALREYDLVGRGASLVVTGADPVDLKKRTVAEVAPTVGLPERLIADLSSSKSSHPVSFTKTANSFKPPGSTQSQAQSGRKSKKGPLITGLIGLGLVGAGAYFIATPNPPRTVSELFDEGRINRRYGLGVPLVTIGAIVAVVGFLKMR